jgi:hypothetical protein
MAHGADANYPNFDASALSMAMKQREYRLAVALVAGPIPLATATLQNLLAHALTMPTAQELYQFLQLLFCCGLPPTDAKLEGLLIAAAKNNDTLTAELLVRHGVSTSANEAECLSVAVAHANWLLVDAILETSISPAQASVSLFVVPLDAAKPDRLHVIGALLKKGATGKALEQWLVRAVEDRDSALINLLVSANAPVSGSTSAIQVAVARKDMRSLRTLLDSQDTTPQSLAAVFPIIRSGYAPPERLEATRLLLARGARGPEVDQLLVDAVADTSATRDEMLISELVRHGVNVNHANGQVIRLAVEQADVPILRLLCYANPSVAVTSAALTLLFSAKGARQTAALPMMELLLAHGVAEGSAKPALGLAVKGGPENLDIVQLLVSANPGLLDVAFEQAIALDSVQKKTPLLQYLMTKNIPQQALDRALVTEVGRMIEDTDSTVVQLLLEHGASVNYNDGEALRHGVAVGNASLVRQLLNGKHVPSQPTVTGAFRGLFHQLDAHHQPKDVSNRVQIAGELLSRDVDRRVVDSSLLLVFNSAIPEQNVEPILNLLLESNANVNVADGTSFVYAAQGTNHTLLEKLLRHQPRFRTVVPTLILSNMDEQLLVRSLEACFAHGCTADDLESNQHGRKSALLLAIERYPRSDSLAGLLLSHGCNPDFTVDGSVEPATAVEILPSLVWALAQPQKMISSSVIVALLEAGASPSRPSPVSEIAPIALAARESRPDIVQALLDCGVDPSSRDKWNR